MPTQAAVVQPSVRPEAVMGSARVARRLMAADSPSQAVQCAAALPAINNHILAKHIQRANNLQQQMLEQELLTCRSAATAPVVDPASHEQQDDAPLPSSRYKHMSDMLVPDNTPETFEAWRAQMAQQLKYQVLQLQQTHES